MFRFTDLIIFRFTRDCNLNCKYCFMTNKHEFKGEMITHKDFTILVDKIIKTRVVNGLQNKDLDFVFHGGEALMIGKKRFYQSAEYIRNKASENNCKLNLSMQTNGVLLDDEYAKILQHFHINVGLSFDGINDSNKERDIKQEVFENKFEILKDNKVNYGFLVVAGKHNIDHINETREYLEEKDLHYKINYAEDMFNPGENSEIEIEGSDFFKKVYEPELERYIKYGKSSDSQMIEILSRTIIDIFTFNESEAHTGCGTMFCGSCIGMIGVNPDGTSHYCDRYDKEYEDTYVMNNLTDYDFLGLNQIKRALDFNLSRHNVVKNTGCDTCFARNICDGGCMAFQRSKYGKDGIDKRLVCGLYKNFYSYVLKNIEEFAEMFINFNKEFSFTGKFLGLKNDMLNLLKKDNIELIYNVENEHVYHISFKKVVEND